MTKWLPIETAPKDGTRIDVWAATFKIKAGKLVPCDKGDRITNVWWGKPYYNNNRQYEPQWVTSDIPWIASIETETYSITHWMPLPEPPHEVLK